MAQINLRLRVLGACFAVFGAIALDADAVLAETGANWMVNGSNVTSTLLPEVQVKEVENSDYEYLFKSTGGTHVAILCKQAALIKVTFQLNGDIGFSIKTKKSGCTISLNGKLSTPCEPHFGTEKGVIQSRELSGTIVLHSSAGIIQLKPTSGETIAVVELGEFCSIGEVIELKGVVTFKDSALTTESVTHLISPGPLTILKALGQPVSITGTEVLQLAGAHSGLKWSGLPA
jgi:hypothetical protein